TGRPASHGSAQESRHASASSPRRYAVAGFGVEAGEDMLWRTRNGAKRQVQYHTRPPPTATVLTQAAMTEGPAITYRDAGVDIDAGDELVERIKPLVRRAQRREVLAGIGGFGALIELPAGLRQPVLVAGTDGVGTKLRLAIELGRHDTIGIDLVAMCANDVVVQGAEPLFFLDYFATGSLDTNIARQVIAGIAEGCRQAGAALIGGETAEMPGMYQAKDYDLAGFCVGAV